MTILTWNISSCIENSLIDFIRAKVLASSLQLLDCNGVAQNVNVYAGRDLNENWNLPLIQIYLDSKPDANRLEIGTNKRLRSFQIIFDIRTLLPGQESNLADWIEEQINNGITIYDYTPNPSNPDLPTKVILGYGRVDFITSLPVPLFDDADKFDQNRYRLTIKLWVNQ
jgi:hypothetical protein